METKLEAVSDKRDDLIFVPIDRYYFNGTEAIECQIPSEDFTSDTDMILPGVLTIPCVQRNLETSE